jgi:DNA-binding MarR family transcriptional regulator
MRLLALSPGLSQRELCSRLSILPSRLVVLVDELENKNIVERQDDPNDRRSYALHLTGKGRKMMVSLREISQAHGEAMTEGLSSDEQTILVELLSKIAEFQGLSPGIHPGYKS